MLSKPSPTRTIPSLLQESWTHCSHILSFESWITFWLVQHVQPLLEVQDLRHPHHGRVLGYVWTGAGLQQGWGRHGQVLDDGQWSWAPSHGLSRQLTEIVRRRAPYVNVVMFTGKSSFQWIFLCRLYFLESRSSLMTKRAWSVTNKKSLNKTSINIDDTETAFTL